MENIFRDPLKVRQRFGPKTDIVFDENTRHAVEPEAVQQVARKTPPFLQHHVIGAGLLPGKRRECSAIKEVLPRIKPSCRVVVFRGTHGYPTRLDCNDFVLAGADGFAYAPKRYRDVCPLAERVGYIQDIARRPCRGKKVLSWSGIADREAFAAGH